MTRVQWASQLFGAVDQYNLDAFVSFLTEDVYFRFGNLEAVQGRTAVHQLLDQFLATLGGLRHEVDQVVEHEDIVHCHGHVTYTRKDGSTMQAPFATHFRLREGLIHEYLIFLDASAL